MPAGRKNSSRPGGANGPSSPDTPEQRLLACFRGRDRAGESFRRLVRALRESAMPHVFVGAIALHAYGGPAVLDRLEVCLGAHDCEQFTRKFDGPDYERLYGQHFRLADRLTKITVELIPSGEPAGDVHHEPAILWPEPTDSIWHGDFPLVGLPQQIELLLARWDEAGMAQLEELASAVGFPVSLVDELHPALRGAFLEVLARSERG